MIWVVVVLGSVGTGWLLGLVDVVANARYATESAPQHLLTVMLGITIGLYERDRVRLRQAYSSPSMAWIGKVLLFASLSLGCACSFSPLDWPTTCLQASVAVGSVGIPSWVGNLPPRL